MKILAIICARNELAYLRHVLPYLAGEGVEVALIDNGSSDGTLEAVAAGAFPNVVRLERFPYTGLFDLAGQLEIKAALARETDADWLIHQDADEILTSPEGWGGLRQEINQADAAGFNVVNFNELVMLPDDPDIDDIFINNTLFYFFEPRPLRLMRAWKRIAHLSHAASGGHELHGEDVCVYPKRMLLKHFIVRSQAHAHEKYLNRTFSHADLLQGWHGNRRDFTRNNLLIPTVGEGLYRLATPFDAPDRLPLPIARHFWEWR
ncbi:MAG: glycosyltransferase family 2 protein [Brevundimonas sp.]|uniref:glycosyltransferase family 2 protein n=1 Tax=Brevundimonas sp. TaxID=1871086 RepID=UPI00391C1D32